MSGMVKEKKWARSGALGWGQRGYRLGRPEKKGNSHGTEKSEDSTKEFERALALEEDRKYVLRLYVTGTTPKSVSAIRP